MVYVYCTMFIFFNVKCHAFQLFFDIFRESAVLFYSGWNTLITFLGIRIWLFSLKDPDSKIITEYVQAEKILNCGQNSVLPYIIVLQHSLWQNFSGIFNLNLNFLSVYYIKQNYVKNKKSDTEIAFKSATLPELLTVAEIQEKHPRICKPFQLFSDIFRECYFILCWQTDIRNILSPQAAREKNLYMA